jgi:HlyD family secretion protein
MKPRPGGSIGAALLLALLAASCARQAPPDAYGNVEATEVVVGAESAGRLVAFTVNEGDALAADASVGEIDATQLQIEREQAAAQRGASESRIDEVRRQIAVLEAQRGAATAQRDAARAQRGALVSQQEIAQRAYDRTKRLIADQAATAQQLDQTERDVRVLADQIKAQDEQIRAQDRQIAAQDDQIRAAHAQEQTARAQAVSAEAQVNQVADLIRKTAVRNPIAGTVLTTYAKAGEMVSVGQPLYRVANLKSVDVRAYVTEPQLASIRLGQRAAVSFDAAKASHQTLTGDVTWISSRAEFTPTPIQTREERADLVYAIKIRVQNEQGLLKIGMPVDVQFTAGSPQ